MGKKGLYGWMFALLTGMILFSGCIGGTSQPSVYYVFQDSLDQASPAPGKVDQSIGVGPVKIPEFLKRPQIVRRQGNNVLEINEFHRWGDSLEAQVMETLVENLSQLLDTPDVTAYPWESSFVPSQQIYIDFRKFDGQAGGPVLLEAVWRIIDTKENTALVTRRSSYSVPTDNQKVEDYVKALNTALEKLSLEIAASLVE